MQPIPVKLPESFEAALGYQGELRWVAFYWEPCGDEAMYDDGFCSGDGNWFGFLKFVEHPRVSPWLSDYELGSSDFEAKHWLLCDLESREVYVGEKEEVKSFLKTETEKVLPNPSKIECSDEELKKAHVEIYEKLMAEIRSMPLPSMEEVERHMREEQEATERMVLELGKPHSEGE